MTEQQYQSKIIKEYESKGWYCLKLIKTNKNGIPDLLCLKSNEKPLFIEVKAINGVLSKLQEYRIDELISFNFDAIVLKSKI
jgi:Holliday junction resolvase